MARPEESRSPRVASRASKCLNINDPLLRLAQENLRPRKGVYQQRERAIFEKVELVFCVCMLRDERIDCVTLAENSGAVPWRSNFAR